MRKITVCMMFLFLGMFLNAQTKNKQYKFSEAQVNELIKEVYQDKANTIIFSDEIRYQGFKNLLLNRITIYKQNFKEGEQYQNLSEFELLKTYNQNLSRNSIFSISNFNPLKYDINLYSNKEIIYRIDKQHVLHIASQKTNKK